METLYESFELLWKKVDRGSVQKTKGMQSLRLPPTVCMKTGSVPAWYFVSKKDNSIKKKNSWNVDGENILRDFTKFENKKRFMMKSNANTTERFRSTNTITACYIKTKNNGQIVVQYLTSDQLKNLLINNDVENDIFEERSAFIQKFVPSTMQFLDYFLHVRWTPRGSVINAKVFKFSPDVELPFQLQNSHHTVSRSTRAQIGVLTENIVSHFKHFFGSNYTINEISYVCKCDVFENNLWLCFINRFIARPKLRGSAPEKTISYQFLNKKIRLKRKIKNPMKKKKVKKGRAMQREQKFLNKIVCPCCHSLFLESEAVGIAYRTIVYYNEDQYISIPEIIIYSEKHLSLTNYMKYKHLTEFLNRKALLCGSRNCGAFYKKIEKDMKLKKVQVLELKRKPRPRKAKAIEKKKNFKRSTVPKIKEYNFMLSPLKKRRNSEGEIQKEEEE